MRKLLLYLILLLIVAGIFVFLLWKKPAGENNQQPTTSFLNQPRISLALVATGLGKPTAIVSTPDPTDPRLFVADRAGVIRIIDGAGQPQQNPFLDIRDKVQAHGEMGLLGVAFDPAYKTNGKFYVDYIDKSSNSVVASFKVSKNADQADSSSEKILLTLAQPFPNHNGGNIAFGPDKYLYIAFGDGGSGGDPGNRAQNLNVLFGKILRIDIRKDSGYSIPPDNPFVGKADAKAEIWDWGLRNPWKFSFDKKTGDLWIADVGQNKIEEVDLEKAGGDGEFNYGWRCYEGSEAFNLADCKNRDSYTFPIVEYYHNQHRCSVTGGYVYRGKKYKVLSGKYFYADYCTGEVFMAEQKEGKWEATVVLDTPYQITTFGQDGAGELYLADFATGSIYLIQDIAN